MFARWQKIYRARPRTWGAFAVMFVVALLLFWMGLGAWPMRLSLAWDAGVAFYVVAVLRLAYGEDSEAIQIWAERDDDGAVLILILVTFAAVASVGAIGYQFATAAPGDGIPPIVRIALAAGTIILSWLMVHMSFAVHYAHEYYGKDEGESRYGLLFPKRQNETGYDPDYWDFFYFSANLGAAVQTSDVQIISREMRRLVLAHSVFAFLFNTLIISLGVNVAASVISG